MTTTRSRLEKRLAKFLAATPPLGARPAARHPRIDLIYIADDDQDRLDRLLRE